MTARRVQQSALLLGAALVTWILVIRRLRGMDAGPGTDLGGLGWFVGVWGTMMAAMMPLSAPRPVLLFDQGSAWRPRPVRTGRPYGERLTRVFAVAFVAAGIWIAVSPGSAPGLTQPEMQRGGTEMKTP